MQPLLTLLIAEQHIADLRRAADHHRLARAAIAARTSDADKRPVVTAPVALMRPCRSAPADSAAR